MKVRTTFAALITTVAIGWVLPHAGYAESKTVIESKDGVYKETHQGDDGSKSEYVVDEKNGTRVYKDSTGVEMKEEAKDGKFEQKYQDKNCQRETQGRADGDDSKVVTRSSCDD